MKFTRRSERNTFYSNRRKLANKKARDLPDLDLPESDANIFISESLTPYKKKLFGNVNKEKKRLKWKFIWNFSGRIFISKNEHLPVFLKDFKMNTLAGRLHYLGKNEIAIINNVVIASSDKI